MPSSAGDAARCISAPESQGAALLRLGGRGAASRHSPARGALDPHDDERSPPEACKGALSVQRAAKTLRFLRALPPRLVDGCSPPWRLWRTYTPQPHECMARARPNLEHRAGEARQAPVAVSRMATASVNVVEFVHRCSRRSPAHQLRTAAEQDLLTALSARLVFAQTNA